MVIVIAIVVLVVVASILGLAATRPDTLQVRRDILISAPPETVFALVDDFHYWGSWAPQDQTDPTMKRSYSGAASGIGAISEWDSTGPAGKGRMEIAEASPPNKITIHVDFVKPFEAHNTNEFTFEPAGKDTEVTWVMHGANVYMLKIMSLFIDVDRMMGKRFEDGLRALRTAAQAKATQHGK
jgi:carbon monoxide dehydrogenase subunit G